MGNIAEKAAQKLQQKQVPLNQRDEESDLFDLVCQYSRLRSQPRAPDVEAQLRVHDQALTAAQRILLSQSRDPQSRKIQRYLARQLKAGVELLRNEHEISMSAPSAQMSEVVDDGFIIIDIARESETLVPVTHPALAEVATRYGAVRASMAESIASISNVLPDLHSRALQQLLDAFDRAWRAAAQICSEQIYTQDRMRSQSSPASLAEAPSIIPPQPATKALIDTAAPIPTTVSTSEVTDDNEIQIAPPPPAVAPVDVPNIERRIVSKQEVLHRHRNALRLQHWLELGIAIAQKWEAVVPWLFDEPQRTTQLTQVQTVEQFEAFCDEVQRTIKITRADQDALFDSNCCPICFEPYDALERQQVTPMPAVCGHVFCYGCGVDMLHKFRECPFCRKPFTAMRSPNPQ